eukprot:6210033-Pleurochrysis_carterae.AAC.3
MTRWRFREHCASVKLAVIIALSRGALFGCPALALGSGSNWIVVSLVAVLGLNSVGIVSVTEHRPVRGRVDVADEDGSISVEWTWLAGVVARIPVKLGEDLAGDILYKGERLRRSARNDCIARASRGASTSVSPVHSPQAGEHERAQDWGHS